MSFLITRKMLKSENCPDVRLHVQGFQVTRPSFVWKTWGKNFALAPVYE